VRVTEIPATASTERPLSSLLQLAVMAVEGFFELVPHITVEKEALQTQIATHLSLCNVQGTPSRLTIKQTVSSALNEIDTASTFIV
jgi:hypothetical protein